ncbi:ComEA family DNA-binding protein [Sphaerisporangium perillae]|uniref:ComEA family DNA-binding protein n=1 Tax=Sphaerisporangium perillae TaxID=2935860 RepID=UPI00200D121B|nr:ComEA family DNA-binding protein [Sphaerisporangium perillae]
MRDDTDAPGDLTDPVHEAIDAGESPVSGGRPVSGSYSTQPASAPADRLRSEPLPSRSLRVWLANAVVAHGPRFDPGRPGVRVLLVLGLFAALAAGVYAWQARPRLEPLSPPMPAGVSPLPAGGSPLPSTGLAATPTPVPSLQVIVHVTGKVRKPGLIALPSGSRVADAVTAAGGVRAGARAGALNLARKLVDGEQIVVGAPSGPGPATAQAIGSVPGTGAPLDLNAATPTELETLPGVGEVLAGRIVEFRQSHAGFQSIDQLRQVAGIGERKFAELRDKVRV